MLRLAQPICLLPDLGTFRGLSTSCTKVLFSPHLPATRTLKDPTQPRDSGFQRRRGGKRHPYFRPLAQWSRAARETPIPFPGKGGESKVCKTLALARWHMPSALEAREREMGTGQTGGGGPAGETPGGGCGPWVPSTPVIFHAHLSSAVVLWGS